MRQQQNNSLYSRKKRAGFMPAAYPALLLAKYAANRIFLGSSFALLVLPVILSVSTAAFAASTTHTTDTDFSGGAFPNSVISGSGASASVIMENAGYAVGRSGTILYTNDGGSNWSTQTSGTTNDLWDAYFIDSKTGWVVGSSGTILHTTDSGSNWSSQTSGSTASLRGVSFVDANTGWVSGSSGAILHTTDGGDNWSSQTSGTSDTLWRVHFIDVNNGWAVGGSGTVINTTDGGSNWSAQTSGTTQSLTGLYFVDANNGWAVGNGDTILNTTDGGSNWTSDSTGTGLNLRGIYFFDVNTGWMVGAGETWWTTNGGGTWNQVGGAGANLNAIHFIDADTGWEVGASGKLRKSTNGGTSWSDQTSGTSNDLWGVFFTDAFSGSYTSASLGLAFGISAAGNSWSSMASMPAATGFGSQLVSTGDDYLYTFRGGISGNRYTHFWRYSVSGDSWSAMTPAPAGIGYGGSLVYPGSGDYIYAFRGDNTTSFWRYSISGNSWSTMTTAPAAVNHGGSLVYPDSGDYIYAFRGNDTTSFWRYSISGDSWSTMTAAPGTVRFGGSLVYPGSGDYIYAFRGNSTTDYWRYSISGDSWESMAAAPVAVHYAASLVYPITGDYIYASIETGATFWRYSISGDSWESMTDAPASFSWTSSLAYPGSGNYLYAVRAANTTDFWRTDVFSVQESDFTTLDWTSTVPANTTLIIDMRAGDTATPDGSWTSWQTSVGSGASNSASIPSALNNSQYVQYRVNFSTTDTSQSASLDAITINYTTASLAGITVNPTSGLTTTEAAGQDTFTVVLDSQPSADVTIGISSSDTSEGTVSPSSLTFTSGNWDTAQTVTVTGVNDDIDDGDIAYTIITAAATSSDTDYNGLNAGDVSVTNTDNDTAGITVNPTSGLTTTEAGGTDTFTVALDSQPAADVTIGLSSSDTTEGTVSPSSLTFTSGNWNSAQTVTVTGVDDALDDGNVGYTIVTAAASSSDTDYNGLNAGDVSVTNTDDDTAGITVNPTSGLTTTEAGGTDTFTVVLTSQPTADVTIGLSSSDTTEGTVSPTSLTFTSGNWNSAQTVTVTGVNDDIIDGNIAYTIVTAAATSSDGNYNGLNAGDVSVTNNDNDVAGITVNPTSGLTTTEAGGTDTFTVVLDTQPTADVTIGLSSSDTGEGTVSPSSLTFTNGNWNSTQTVTITGVNDAIIDGDIAYSVVTAAATSSDTDYNGLNAGDVSVTNNDNDVAGITVNPTSGLTTTEAGGTDTFTVVLDTQPAADVTIGLSSSDTTEGTVSPASLTFTSGNWNSAQSVTVTGVNDDIDDGNIGYTVVTAAASSSDTDYNGLNASDVSVTNTDNDMAGITVNPTSGLTTTEGGGTDTFTVVLDSQPTADVTIGLSSSDTGEGTVSPSSFTFTSVNWNSAQTVTVTGVDDALDDGNVAYTIVTAAASSSDTDYNGLNASDVSVTNTDNDTAGITVNPTSGLTTTEAGGTDTFTVVLDSQPTADVTIGLSSSDTGEGTVSPSSLTFTSGNWNSAQTVTATGVDDALDDGNIAYSIVTAAASSSDGNYNGLNASDVAVTNNDDDTAGITVNPTSGLTTTEAGGTDTFTVVLDTQPTADVTIGLSSSDTTEGTVSPASLTFTSGNWNSAQTVTVTGEDDVLMDGNVAYTIVTAAATSTDGGYSGLNASDVSVTNSDDDTPGITVNPTSGLTTTEAGGTDTFTVVLNTQPSADVTIGLSSSDTTEGTVSPSSLTFTSGNWNSAQTVTATGVDDALDDGNIVYSIVTAAASSSDGNYNGLNTSDVSVTNTDNDTAGITVNPTAGLTTTEAGGTDTFTVVLTTQPTADVTIGLSRSDTTEGTVSPNSLTFTSANWSSAQTVTVTGVDDALDDGNIGYTIDTAAATSSDTDYNGMNASDVSVTNTDNDVAGITVSPASGLTTTEDGGTDTFTVVLDTQPSADVTIGLSSSDTTEGTVSPNSLTFTTANWNSAQTVTVTGVDDVVIDGNIAYSVVTAAATSSDTNYNGLNAGDVSVSNTDDDTTGITVNPVFGLTTTEAGGTDTFTVVLDTQPGADVTIGLSSSDTGEGTVSPSSLTFTSGNWNSAQTVTVTGVDDGDIDGDIAYTIITAAASSSDPGYNGINAGDVSVTNTDDEEPLPTVTVTASTVTAAETDSGIGAYTVTRTGNTGTDLLVNYTVGGTATADSDYTALSGSVLISSGNSSAVITLTLIDDIQPEDDETVIITLSSDSAYTLGNPKKATFTIMDNEPRITISTTDPSAAETENTQTGVLTIIRTRDVSNELTVNYTVSGTATSGVDYMALPSSITLAANKTTATLTITPLLDSEPEYVETVIVTISTDPAYYVGSPSSGTVTIADLNVAPKVELTMQQNGENRRIISTDGGNVTILAQVTDANPGDTHSYDWSATHNAIVFSDNSTSTTKIFDPSVLLPGFYSVRIRVADNALAKTEVELIIKVMTTLPTLSQTSDSDNDGAPDQIEGFADASHNGIPDYLEPNMRRNHELQQTSQNDTYFITTEDDLVLKLGSVAFITGSGGAKVTLDDIADFGGEGGNPGLYTEDDVTHFGHYFDFEVTNLATPGQSVMVVIPQYTALPANARYRKYDYNFGWQDFVVNSDNAIASAPGSSGTCPAPGDAAYVAGLTAGHWCVQVTIEDGGPNDGDSVRNYVIKDLAVIGVAADSTTPDNSGTDNTDNNSGGGAVNFMVCIGLMLYLSVIFNLRRRGIKISSTKIY